MEQPNEQQTPLLPWYRMLGRALNPFGWYAAYRTQKKFKERLAVDEFAHKHKNLVVIVLDPEDDTLFMAYRDQRVYNKIKTADGQNHHIVKSVMKAGRFKSNIDFFLVAIIEILKVKLTHPAMQDLIKWVDGATYSISQRLSKLKNEDAMFPKKLGEKEPEKEMAILNSKNY